MSGRKPTLGFSSRTEAVLAMRQRALTTEAIASLIGIEPKTVIALEISAARCRQIVREGAKTVLLPPDLIARLRPHAARRDLSVGSLVRQLIESALDDNLIDAVLDDQLETAA
jgi:hypothetical protein